MHGAKIIFTHTHAHADHGDSPAKLPIGAIFFGAYACAYAYGYVGDGAVVTLDVAGGQRAYTLIIRSKL